MTENRRNVKLAIAGTVGVACVAGTAYWAWPSADKNCVASQEFLTPASPFKMEFDMMKAGLTAMHTGHNLTKMWSDPAIHKYWGTVQDCAHQRRNPNSIWGDIPEDERNLAHDEIHCGELLIPTAENIAKNIWPIQEPSLRTNQGLKCEKGEVRNGDVAYPCSKVDLQSFVPLRDFESLKANDIWGWVDPDTNKEYAIIGLGEGTGFIDVTIPTQPVVVAVLPTHTTDSTWRDIKVYNNRAFVVSEARGHGMQVFNLMRLGDIKTTTRVEADYTWLGDEFDSKGHGSSHNMVINEETGRGYIVGSRDLRGRTSYCRGGLVIMDLKPEVPKQIGCFDADGYTHDAECVIYKGPDSRYTGEEICFAYNEDTVSIVKVTDASKPELLSRTPYDNSHYTHQGWLDAKQEFIYMNDELDEVRMDDKRTRTFIFDVSDLTNAKYHSTHYHDVNSIDHNNYIVNGLVYQANYCAGLRVLKIKEDHGLEEVAYFDTEPECNDARFSGVWSVYPYLPSGNIVVSSIPRGLFVLKLNL